MVKFLGLMRLKPGQDPKETLELWRTKYSPAAAKILLPELKHYTRNRVVRTIGDSDIYGFSEMLFNDIESCERAFERRLSSTPADQMPLWTVERIIAEFEEVPLL